MSRSAKQLTPVRSALRSESSLFPLVADGLNALESGHRVYIKEEIRASFSDSLNIDENLREGREQEHRWDYLLGVSSGKFVVAMEPHTATDDQIQRVIQKRKHARDQLRSHLKDGASVVEWFWVASGKNRFSDTERTRRILDQNGIRFVCPAISPKHLRDLVK